MYYIITKDKKKFEWHVQDRKPKFEVPFNENHIILLQASGHELEQIRGRFDNLPIAFGICTWRNEMAQFIYDNL